MITRSDLRLFNQGINPTIIKLHIVYVELYNYGIIGLGKQTFIFVKLASTKTKRGLTSIL